MKTKRPAAALGSDGQIYVNIDELLDEETCRVVYEGLGSMIGGDLFIAIRLQGLATSDAMARVDDAVAEVVASRRVEPPAMVLEASPGRLPTRAASLRVFVAAGYAGLTMSDESS